MAASIRLTRIGRKGRAFYRIVVADKRAKRTGKAIESLGYYDSESRPPQLKVDKDKLDRWLKNGAILTATARKLLSL